MKHLLKGAASLVITMFVLITINVFCNMRGIELNTIAMTFASALLALSIYHLLIRNENNDK